MAIFDDYRAANRQAQQMLSSVPKAVAARYDRANRRIVIHLSSRLEVSFSPRDVQGLEHARPTQLEPIEISPSGFGIHFPKLDADLYVPGLLEGFVGAKQWMASRLGHTARRSRSIATRRAARDTAQLAG